jgi:hypothetical protein
VPGCLWRLDQIDVLRCDAAPPLRRIVVAIDPSGSGNDDADECGIIAAGIDDREHGYVLADASAQMSPIDWAKAAIHLYHVLGADRIIVEVNFDAEMVEAVMRSIDPNIPFRAVHASRGKAQRAEPISSLYEQHRVHHCGAFPGLEDEMVAFTTNGYVGGGSPNRADALVWALSDLRAVPIKGEGLFEYYRQMALGMGRPAAMSAVSPADRDIETVREAFYRRLNGRQPTGQEINDLEAELAEIHRGGNKTAALLRREATQASATPDHPDVPATVFEAINGPQCRPHLAKGSVENP